ncbi:MAG TPA: twin-arginine translocation signal domain-containing protein [Gammaproteobacteria bacterium]|nr:twin-arginine translocation signal domain-containing protein [Gammaproteobacteria bacterium]
MITRRKFLKMLGFGAAAGTVAAVLPAGELSLADIERARDALDAAPDPDYDFPPSVVHHMGPKQDELNFMRTKWVTRAEAEEMYPAPGLVDLADAKFDVALADQWTPEEMNAAFARSRLNGLVRFNINTGEYEPIPLKINKIKRA